MARLASRSELPRYNMALGATEETLVAVPPFTFPGVTARVFPLRASMNTLRAFCQNYLNVAPEVCEFFPYFPYVLLVVLDYGRMAIEKLNLGWVSQHEILFGIPLGMWRRDRHGRRVFERWVVNTPFIVVDNAASLTTGRETYGWPKVLATLQTSPERWLIDPRNPTRFLTLDFIGLDSDDPDIRLLEIEQQTGQNAPFVPPDFEMLDPFARLSRFTRASMSLWFDMVQLLVGAPLSGFRRQRPGERAEVLFDSLRRLSGFYDSPGVDVVTLKQFPDSEDPTQICYQALVKSRLGVARYNRGGPLGLYNFLQGDITGGFRIRLHHHPAFPIVESLGLEVAQERGAASLLEPVYPFWMSVDLTYGKGETLCWRTRRLPWHREKAPVSGVPPTNEASYNTIAGGAEQVWRGPYLIPEASFDVYPLEAHPERLRDFLNRYLNADGQLIFELVMRRGAEKECPYVYMVASANRMFSQARSGACIVTSHIAFYVPLRVTLEGMEREVLATPFAFVDNPVLATTMREVEGVPAMYVTIKAPSRFLRREGPLLTMQGNVFAALGAGLRSEPQTLLEVVPGEKISSGVVEWTILDPIFGERTAEQPMPEERPVLRERLMLKQFRDAHEPDRACYQSLVVEPWTVRSRTEPEPLQHEMAIHVYRYPSLPLVETLGLVTAGLEIPSQQGGTVADVLKPHQPYRTELSLEIGLGREVCRTAGFLPWF